MNASPDFRKILLNEIEKQSPSLIDLYKHFHAYPELSGQELLTARRVAEELQRSGCKISTGIGGHGVVGLVENGPGPVLMLRADMDALPIREETGLPYASRNTAIGTQGKLVPVMHACGHDLHTTILIGTARILTGLRQDWKGTLVLVAQPAEEAIGGARLMLQDGLFTRFPHPNWALALHVDPGLPAGKIAIGSGYVTTACQSIDVIIKGRAGHGAMPHLGVDPIVLAAQFILGIQTIVSRRNDPTKAAVIHVGKIEGGNNRNTIAEKITLEISLRAQGKECLEHLEAQVFETATGLALAAGVGPDLQPELQRAGAYTPSVFNDPGLCSRLTRVFEEWLGKDQVEDCRPMLGSEDFSRFGEVDPPVPLTLFRLGVSEPDIFTKIKDNPNLLSRLHTPTFAPVVERSLTVGLECFTAAALELLNESESL